MADFYIVPPRLTVGTFDRANVVNSINSLKGDLTFIADANSGVRVVISGNTFRFSITENYYVKKQGDTYPKNLIFSPEAGYYGLAVGSASADPGTGSTGGLFFNTTSSTLKVYDGSTWSTIPGTGITQGAADLRYLKLDGTNTPTANISMGSQFLRLANLTTQALPGITGQMFFNTSTGRINVYNGTYWDDVGLGVTSIQIGFGLTSTQNPIVQSGTVSVDLTANYTWTGTHNFTSPVTFSAAGQSFNITKLFISGQSAGDLIYFNGTNWTRLGIGSTSQALVVDTSGTAVTWGAALSTSAGLGLSTLNGIGSTVQYFAVGSSGSLFNISSVGSTHTFNIPIAGTGATGLVSTGTQTFTGAKTFDTALTISSSTGSGSTSTGALIVSGGVGIGGSLFTSSAYSSSISGVVLSNGVITSGTWAGSTITAFYGGTGNTIYSKGDLLVGIGGTLIRLAVGTDNYVLTASSASATGLTWTQTAATGITTINTLTATTQYFATGASGSLFNISSSGSTHTFNIPIASTGSTGLVSTLAQSFAGTKTFTGDVVITSSTASTYMANGALTVNGGVGISGQLSVNQVAMGYTGIATNPVMAFIGSTNTAPITMSVLSDGSLLWEGSSGKLFGINNNLSSGWIFNVGDISGLPIIRANADGTVAMAEFAANVGIGLSNPSYKLHVVGDTNLSSGYVYRINGTSVLSSTQVLGLTVTSGNITSGAWSGTAISVPYGGTGLTSYTVGDILYASGSSTLGRLAAGTAGSVLISAGAGATPYYSSPALFTSGNATTAANINIVSATTGTFYPLFTNISSSASGVAVSVDSGISFDSATDTLTAGKFSGLHTGTAATFTNIYGTLTGSATTATNINSVSTTGTNASHFLMFSPVNGGSGVALSSGIGLTFNPSSGQLGLGTGSALINGLLLGTSANTITTASGNLTINASGGTVLVAGNLNVQGTATYIDSTTETITDPVIVLGSGAGGTHTNVTDTQDRGIEYRRYSGSAITGFFGFSNASGRFTFIPNANVTANNTYAGSVGVIEANITGTAITATNLYGALVGNAASATTAGLATTAQNLNISATTTGTLYPLFTSVSTSASGVAVSVDGTDISYDAATNTLTAGKFSGLHTGTAATFTNIYGTLTGFATTATNVNVVLAATNASHQVLFTPTSGTASGVAISSETSFVYNPSTDILSVSGLAVTASTGSTSTSTGALVVTGGAGIGGSLYTSSSYANSLSGVVLNNGVITSASWSATAITARYGGTGNTTYTLGDLLVGAGSTFIKLPVGINSYVLGADSTQPSGVGWTTVTPLTVSDTPPASPKNADLWFNSQDGGLLVYYKDVDTSQWVEIALGSGIDLTQPVHITSTVGSTSVNTGALIVDGGVGVNGTVHALALSINGTYDLVSEKITFSTTTPNQVLGQVDASIYRSIKCMVQITHGSDHQVQEILSIHDDVDTYLTQYGQLLTGNNLILATYDADLSGGYMRILVTPTYTNTTFRLYCQAMRI